MFRVALRNHRFPLPCGPLYKGTNWRRPNQHLSYATTSKVPTPTAPRSGSAPFSARPIVGDILSFNSQPDREEDIVECTVKWHQEFKNRSAKYMAFKARNVSTVDAEPDVPVFVQSSYYSGLVGDQTDVVEFPITTDWQYGEQDETGTGRFVVLHDKSNRPYQRRFIESKAFKEVESIVEAAAAKDIPILADIADEVEKWAPGEYLISYTSDA